MNNKNNKNIIKYEDIFEITNNINGSDFFETNNENNKNVKEKYNKLVKKQKSYFLDNILIKVNSFLFDSKLIKKINEYNLYLKEKNKTIYDKKFLNINLFNIINIWSIFLILLTTIIVLNNTKKNFVITLFKIKQNFNNFLSIIISIIFIIYSIFKLEKKKKFKNFFNLGIFSWTIIFLSMFLINFYYYFKINWNFWFWLMAIFFFSIFLISNFFYFFNIFHIKLFGLVYGEILFIIIIYLWFIYYYLFIFEKLLESNIIVITMLAYYFLNFVFLFSYKLNFESIDYYKNIIKNWKNKLNFEFFKFYFKQKWLNESYHSILVWINFVLIFFDFLSLLIYSLFKFYLWLKNPSNRNIFIRNELSIYLLQLFIFVTLLVVLYLNRILKNKDILFLIIKMFLIFFFVIVFNSEVLFDENIGLVINLLNSTEIKVYFYIFIIFISFFPIFDLKFINLVNSFKFGLIFVFSLNLISFYISNRIMPLSALLIFSIIGFTPLFIILINYIKINLKFKKIEKPKYLKNQLFILLFSYIYDIIIIFILTVYINNLSQGNLNNLNLISFFYCLIIYILIFISNILKFKKNFDLKKEKIISVVLDSQKNSFLIFIITIVVIFILYIIIMIIFNLVFELNFANYIITFYTLYIYFIWITFYFFLKNLGKFYKKYLYLYNLTILILFTIPFNFLTSFMYNIYIISNFNSETTNNIINLFLFLIIICFSLWGVILSLIINIIFSKIVYENMVQYITLNLKIDCYTNYIFTEIPVLREFIDTYFKYKHRVEFEELIKNGEIIIWWESKNIENIKKKLLLKENLNVYLKILAENYNNKQSFLEKILCIKKFEPEKNLEINNDNSNNEDIYENLVQKFNDEKEENFIKEEYEDVEVKNFNYKLLGELINKLIQKNKILKENQKDLKFYKEVYLCMRNFFNNRNIENKYNNDIKMKTENISKLKNLLGDMDNILDEDYVKKRNDILKNKDSKINELLDLYKDKNKLYEILKVSEDQRKFFLFLIYKSNSTSNNNYNSTITNNDEDNENSLVYPSLVNFFKKIKINNFFSSTYRLNLFDKKKIYLKKIFISFCDIKRNDVNKNQFEKLKKQKSIKDKESKCLGISFKQFLIFFENFCFDLHKNVNNFPESPVKYLILKIYTLSKFCLSDFESIIKEIDFEKFRNDLKSKELKKENIKAAEEISKLKADKKKKEEFNKMEKNKIEKEIQLLNENIEKLKIEKVEKIKQNNELLIIKKNELKNNTESVEKKKIIKLDNKYKYEDIIQIEIIRKLVIQDYKKNNINEDENENEKKLLINNKIDLEKPNLDNKINIINESDLENENKMKTNYNSNIKNKNENSMSQNKNENSMIQNKNEYSIIEKSKKNNKDKIKKVEKEEYYKLCFCIKTKYDPKEDLDSKGKKIIKNIKAFINKIIKIIFDLFFKWGFKDPNNILNYEKLKKLQKEPENWNDFSIYLINQLEIHKNNYEKIIYNSSILLNLTNIIFIFSSIVRIFKSYSVLFNSTYPWFSDTLNRFNQTTSTLFFNLFGFKFGISFGFSILYFFVGLYAYKSIKKGTLGLDPKTGKKAKFPHIQFLISIYFSLGESLVLYCVENLSAVFTCNRFNPDLNTYVSAISDTTLCLSQTHFIYLFLSFFGIIGFFFFALIFRPNFQFKEKLLDIKFQPYYIIFDLFFEGLLIIIEIFVDRGYKTLNIILFISIWELALNTVKILILFFLKPCIIKGFNLFLIYVIILDSIPWICNIILVLIRNSIISIIILSSLVVVYFCFITFYLIKKFKKNKISNSNMIQKEN